MKRGAGCPPPPGNRDVVCFKIGSDLPLANPNDFFKKGGGRFSFDEKEALGNRLGQKI